MCICISVYLYVFACICMYLCVFAGIYNVHCKSEESGVGIHEWQRHEPPNVSPDIR